MSQYGELLQEFEPEKDMTMHQGDNQADSNGAKLEEAPF